MKSFDLGRAVKKWLLQEKNYNEIAEVLNSTPEECIEAYRSFMGFSPSYKSSDNLEHLIKTKQKIHIYGGSGVGKTYIIKHLANKLKLQLFVSYPRTEEELVSDFSDYPFQKGDNIFVVEGDAFYWKKYGTIKKYILDSKTAFVIITEGKDTPTKNITKIMNQVKVYPPTRIEVLEWVLSSIDDKEKAKNIVSNIYDKDWRKVRRNFLYKRKETFKSKEKETLDARGVVYKLLKGNTTIEDFDNCIHPLSFILNWLGWNTPNFFDGQKLRYNMELVSFVDANKYSLRKEFLERVLLKYLPANRKANIYFPPFKRNKEEEKEEKPYDIMSFKKRKASKPKSKKEKKTIKEELGDFLLI